MNNDLISREALKEDFKSRLAYCNEWIEKAKDKETKIRASSIKAFIGEVLMTINNAPTVDVDIELAQEREKLYEESKKLYMLAKTLGKEERPQGDLISRSELKKAFEKIYPLATNEMGGVANKRIYEIIDNAPTVETKTITE